MHLQQKHLKEKVWNNGYDPPPTTLFLTLPFIHCLLSIPVIHNMSILVSKVKNKWHDKSQVFAGTAKSHTAITMQF